MRRNNIVEMAILPKANYRYNAICIKSLLTFFTELEQNNPKMYMEPELPKQFKGKKKKTRGINVPDFRQYYKAPVITKAWSWHKNIIWINGTEWRAHK